MLEKTREVDGDITLEDYLHFGALLFGAILILGAAFWFVSYMSPHTVIMTISGYVMIGSTMVLVGLGIFYGVARVTDYIDRHG